MAFQSYFSTTLLLLVVFVSSISAAKNAKKQKQGVMAESNNAFCENLMSAFYVSDNINVMSNASAVARNISEQGCLELCSTNKDPNGRLVFCASVVYDRDQSQCLMYRKSSEPDGELLRKPEDGKRYFEKFCLAEDVPRDCANKQFVRVDDYILKGYAQATAVFPSMAECVAHCIREKDFECRSAMYFYEEGECITNLESAITRPDDFMKPDDDDKVVFFHNGCIQPGLRAEVAASEDEEDNKDDSSSGETPENELEAPATTAQTSTTTAESLSTTQPTTEKITSTSVPQEIVTESPTTTIVFEPSTEQPSFTMETTPAFASSTPALVEKLEIKEEQNKPIKVSKQPIRNIETRLYGAKQLEAGVDGSLQEKSHLGEDTKEVPPPSFTIDPTPTSASAVAEEEEANKGLQPPPALAPRASMPMTALKHVPTKQLQLKPIKMDKKHFGSSDPQEDGYFGKWAPWTVCREAGERRIRRRKCLDLRRCKGALMQVDYCPKDLPQPESIQEEPTTPPTDSPTGPIRNLLPINRSSSSSLSGGAPPSILPPQLPQKELKPLPAGAPGKANDIWSPWLGSCQHFASSQPCKNNEVIGFESRECIAKDPKMCKGPFFRYCTIAC